MTEPSLHSLKETIHGLSESFTYTRADGEGMSRMREMRMSTSCFRAVKECGWHCPLSTEEQVYPFIHHHHHQRIHTHTHTAHSLFTENIWTQLPLGREESNSFCCRWSSGEGEQTGPLFTHGKERETHPDSSARQSHEHGCHWAWWETERKTINITELYQDAWAWLSHICYMFLHHCSVEKMNLEHGGYRTNCIVW